MELTRKDIQNYLVNGLISKEFIHTNKKELQKFIKNQTRSASGQNNANGNGEYMKGYQTYDTQATVVKKRQENNDANLSIA